MPCYHPLTGYRAAKADPVTGRRGITFQVSEAYRDLEVQVPCGQCIGCRLERSRQWAIRCMHEASLHERSCFVTLTYDDAHLPASGSLVKSDFQKFMKRLRKAHPVPIRYFHCGEYGETTFRPHYHALLYGVDFRQDGKPWKRTEHGVLWTSEDLDRAWGLGRAIVGALTAETAAYCARYALKKVTGKAAEDHYRRVNPETGEVYHLQPEYVTMSLRPGIGREWFGKFASDVYPDDFVIAKGGKRAKVPAYYDRLLSKSPEGEALLLALKDKRVARANEVSQKRERTRRRLAVREEVKRAQISTLKRSVE